MYKAVLNIYIFIYYMHGYVGAQKAEGLETCQQKRKHSSI